ncbi:MAG: hypothetical protein RL007_865 [Bacteroidota bacterium]|jgi:PKD repeat protein
MKKINLFAAAAIAALTFTTATAQNPYQFIKVTMTSNSYNPNQSPATMILMFGQGENDSLAFPDAGTEGTLGRLDDNCFPFSKSADGYIITNVDARQELDSYTSVPFGFVNKNATEIKVIASVSNSNGDTVNFLPAYVWLEQLSTGEKYSILGDTAKFDLPSNINFATDFVLHAGPANYLIPTEESCYNTVDASMLFKTPNYNGAAFELKDANGIVASGTMSANDTTIYNLAAGNYVAIIRINNITVDSTDITINPKNPIIADFYADYNSIIIGETVTFTDNSTGAVSYAWNFGDGDSDTTAGTVSHTYIASDYFTVTLTVTDSLGCTSTMTDGVSVNYATIQNPNIGQNHGNGQGREVEMVNVNYTEGQISVNTESAVNVTITAVNGAVIFSGMQYNNSQTYNVPANGVYLVSVIDANGNKKVNTVTAL